MKLVELKCRNCGSGLQVEDGKNEVTCNYCNTTFKFDDEVKHIKYDDMEQAGYDFEKGKIRAQQENPGTSSSYVPCCEPPVVDFIIVFFLGALGVHRFMKNQVGLGIVYLFTGGLFGIGWLIDVIMSLVYFSNSKK